MGGLACWIPKLAILRYDAVPAKRSELKAFDTQMRQCCAQTDIVKGILDAGKAELACEILGKESWSPDDRAQLFEIIQDLYEY